MRPDIAGGFDLLFLRGTAVLDLVQELDPHFLPRLQHILSVARPQRFLKTFHGHISFQR
jgi:hypothetical protein